MGACPRPRLPSSSPSGFDLLLCGDVILGGAMGHLQEVTSRSRTSDARAISP